MIDRRRDLRALLETALEAGRGSLGSEEPVGLAGYEIESKIGRGGAGTVWRAVQKSTGRLVALKVIRHSAEIDLADKGLVQSIHDEWKNDHLRFWREIKITARLDHPNVAKIYESGMEDGVPYYSMELIEGLPVDEYARKFLGNRREIVQLMRKICAAVAHAHQHGIIHRDLKHGNILVTSAEGEPKILDFGLGRALEEDESEAQLSVVGQMLGTPLFMAPEQAMAEGSLIGTRADVYSLGVVFFHLLTGEFPHDDSGTHLEITRRIVEVDPLSPSKLAPSLKGDLEAILLKALEKDPARRYSSAYEMGLDLQAYLEGKPVSARSARGLYHFQKHIKRRWKEWCVGAAAILVFVAFVGRSIYVKQEHAKKESVLHQQIALDSSRVHFLLAAELARRNKIDEAMGALSDALKRDRGNRDAATLAAMSLAQQTFMLPVEGPTGNELVRDVSFSAQGDRYATAEGKNVGIFDASTDSPIGGVIRMGGDVQRMLMAPDGRSLVACDSDGTMAVWGEANDWNAPISTTQHAFLQDLTSFEMEGRYVAATGRNRSAVIWDTQSDIVHLPPTTSDVTYLSVTLDPKGRFAALVIDRDRFRFWDLAKAEVIGEITLGWDHAPRINRREFRFSENGRWLVTFLRDNWMDHLECIDLERSGDLSFLREKENWLSFKNNNGLSGAIIGPGEQLLVIGRNQVDLITLPATQGKDLRPSRGNGSAKDLYGAAAFDREAQAFALVKNRGIITLHNAASGNHLGERYVAEGIVIDLAFNPDGSRLAALNLSGELVVWSRKNRWGILGGTACRDRKCRQPMWSFHQVGATLSSG